MKNENKIKIDQMKNELRTKQGNAQRTEEKRSYCDEGKRKRKKEEGKRNENEETMKRRIN